MGSPEPAAADTIVTDRTRKEREHFFGAARTIAGITMLSRVFGLVRDMLMVPLGGPVLADRFWTAFSVPNLFRRLFGEGALASAFVPVFTEVTETDGWDRARLVLANAAGVLAVVLVALMLAAELGLWAAWAVWGGDWTRLVLLQLVAIMMPFMVTVCMLALGSAALNCRGHFAYPAFAPIILNITLIVTALLAGRFVQSEIHQFHLIAAGLIVAGAAQLVGVVWLLKRARLAAMPTLRPLMPETKRVIRLMAPMMIPLSVLQLSAFADRLIALLLTADARSPDLPLADGVVRCLYAANRLYQLPLGVLAVSIATAVFPLLGRQAARGDVAGLRQTTNRALRLGLFLGVPTGVAMIILAQPSIELIFQRRNFAAFDTARSVRVLQMYCLGMWAYFWNQVLLRAFFSQKDTRTPLILACVLAGCNMLLVVGGVFTPLKAAAIGLATAVTQSAGAILLAVVLHRRWGSIGMAGIVASGCKTALATACVAGALAAVMVWIRPAVSELPGPTGLIVTLTAAVLGGVAAFALVALALRCPELGELRGVVRRTDTSPPERNSL